MKKIESIKKKCVKVMILSSLLIVSLLMPMNISAKEDGEKSDKFSIYQNIPNASVASADSQAIQEFNEMQDKITLSMTFKDGAYNYNYQTIYDIVYNYNFTDLNNELGTNWSKESFLETAIVLIENFESKNNDNEKVCSITSARAKMCGENWETSGWNYARSAMSTNKTAHYITLCNSLALGSGTAGSIGAKMTALVPILSGILFAAGAAGALYYGTFALWLDHNNKLTKCGTVVDINKFTYVYTIWTQPEFGNR